jgi:hypothetical protein
MAIACRGVQRTSTLACLNVDAGAKLGQFYNGCELPHSTRGLQSPPVVSAYFVKIRASKMFDRPNQTIESGKI